MKMTPLLLAAVLTGAGCEQIALIPVAIVENVERLNVRPTTRPWHFEGEHVVFDTPDIQAEAKGHSPD